MKGAARILGALAAVLVGSVPAHAAWYDDGNYPTNMTAVCENLGTACLASELFGEQEVVHSGGSWIDPDTVMAKPCNTTGSVDPYIGWEAVKWDQETAPSNPTFSLPVNHTYVWSRTNFAGSGNFMCDKDIKDSGVRRLCISFYFRMDNTFASAQCLIRRFFMQWNKGSGGSGPFVQMSYYNKLTLYNFDTNEDGVSDGYSYINSSQGALNQWTDCRDFWCRLELCMESDTAANLIAGQNMSFEAITEKIRDSSETARYYMPLTYMGDGYPEDTPTNIYSAYVIATYVNSCTSNARFYIANLTVAGWATPNGQRIGPTPEIGRGYTGYCDASGLNCTGDPGSGGSPRRVILVTQVDRFRSWWDIARRWMAE